MGGNFLNNRNEEKRVQNNKTLAALLACMALFVLFSGCILDNFGQGGKNLTQGQNNQSTGPAIVGPQPPMPGEKPVDVSNYRPDNENRRKIVEVLQTYSYEDESSFSGVNSLLNMSPEAADDAIWLLQKDNVYSRWTALYMLSNMGPGAQGGQRQKIVDALKPMLISDVASFRAMAGKTLLSMGEKDGFEGEISVLGDNQRMMLSEPMELKCQYANAALARFSGQDFGFSCDLQGVDEAAKKKWEEWWQQNKNRLAWDGQKRQFVGG